MHEENRRTLHESPHHVTAMAAEPAVTGSQAERGGDREGAAVTPHPLLRMQDVTRRFVCGQERIDAVQEASLELWPGEIGVVGGPSGSGKSTLLLMATAMLSPSAGRIELFGRDLSNVPASEATAWRGGPLGVVMPMCDLVPYLHALDNVRMAANGPNSRDRAVELLERFGLGDRLGHRPSQLSTGEQRRVLVARGLVNEPELVICDEPTANLDPDNADQIRDQLLRERERGAAVLIVTHESCQRFNADRRWRMRSGYLQLENLNVRVPS